jgi:hypothetical protein
MAWAGFVAASAEGKGGYALLFRELNPREEYSLPISFDSATATAVPLPGAKRSTVLGGRGTARISDGVLTVTVPDKLDFVWVKLE